VKDRLLALNLHKPAGKAAFFPAGKAAFFPKVHYWTDKEQPDICAVELASYPNSRRRMPQRQRQGPALHGDYFSG
jgi:hypothetical protein